MKMTRFQTFCIQIRKNKPLDESCKTGQTSRMKMTFYSFFFYFKVACLTPEVKLYIFLKNVR
ncbi:hypothetical protein Hanom_Chr12g01071531 [Helianthus anomalus]